MREAIGNSFLFYFAITFFALFIFFFVGSLAYTKAFKVKNKIVDEIEIFEGDITITGTSTVLNREFQTSVDEKMSEIGYRISNKECDDNRFSDGVPLTKSGSSNYRYCIYRFDTNGSSNKEQHGVYYAVVAYMYYEIPIVGINLEFPVYGETKVFTELSK